MPATLTKFRTPVVLGLLVQFACAKAPEHVDDARPKMITAHALRLIDLLMPISPISHEHYNILTWYGSLAAARELKSLGVCLIGSFAEVLVS
jgi:hypothetical protein